MADRPIIFSDPEVRALLDGRKTQTRRVLMPQPFSDKGTTVHGWSAVDRLGRMCSWAPCLPDLHPYAPGDRLWVRETWARVPVTAYRMSTGVQQTSDPNDPDMAAVYRAGWERSAPSWRSPIHMPRWASRLTLTVTDVRVQRVQDISEADARAEGCPFTWDGVPYDPPPPEVDNWQGYGRYSFCLVWDALQSKRRGTSFGWDANPWVAALTFTVERQ